MAGPGTAAPDQAPRVLAVDAGRTSCRVAVFVGEHLEVSTVVPAGGTLADPEGADRVREAIAAGAAELGDAARSCTHLGAGFAGVWGGWASIETFARTLGAQVGATEVAVTNDVVIAYAGALGHRPGVLLSAGSGAVALGVGPEGAIARVDGWGYLLGDAGSGYWIGRAGLEAALRAVDGRGSATALVDRAGARHGSVDRLHATITAGGVPARTVAAFATDVVAAAEAGDEISVGIVADAGRELARTVHAAAARTQPPSVPYEVSVVGGLVETGGPVARALEDELARTAPEATLRPAAGDALAGAAAVAVDAGQLGGLVHRTRPEGPASDVERPTSRGLPDGVHGGR